MGYRGSLEAGGGVGDRGLEKEKNFGHVAYRVVRVWEKSDVALKIKMDPAPNIIPRFDLECAKALLQRGRRPSEVIAAAERLGADQLKHAIEVYIGSSQSLKDLQQRELGIRARR